MIDYEIIATGSAGNAVVINKAILIDCGVPYVKLKNNVSELKLVLLTHIHTDHFNKTTIRALARNRPTLMFACGKWLVEALVGCGVAKKNIYALEANKMYNFGACNIIPVPLVHNVPNFGYKIHFPQGKMIYATDTGNLNGITAYHYDLYLIEANYIEEDIKQKITEKIASGEYVYEYRVLKDHLSKSQCDDFIYSNIGPLGKYVYMHCHKEADYDSSDCQGSEI